MNTKNTNHLYNSVLSRSEKWALWMTDKVGSTGFFLTLFVWTVGWLGWNVVAPKPYRFDPFPEFTIWLYVSNLIQILLMPVLMVGQNLQSKHNEIRAENDYEINAKAEKEIEELKKELAEIKAILLTRLPEK